VNIIDSISVDVHDQTMIMVLLSADSFGNVPGLIMVFCGLIASRMFQVCAYYRVTRRGTYWGPMNRRVRG
jgi:hypothetical protein